MTDDSRRPDAADPGPDTPEDVPPPGHGPREAPYRATLPPPRADRPSAVPAAMAVLSLDAIPFPREEVTPTETPRIGAALDDGALAARRTLRPAPHRPASASPETHAAETAHRLLRLAERVEGQKAADLRLAAAEHFALAGAMPQANGAVDAALAAMPSHLAALRLGRRWALDARNWERALDFAARELALPLPEDEKAPLSALMVHLRPDEPREVATTTRPRSLAEALLDARTHGTTRLASAASWTRNPKLAAALLTDAAHAQEATDRGRAEALYARAAQADHAAVDARLGLARTALLGGTPDIAAGALLQLATLSSGTPVGAAAARAAARVLAWKALAPGEAAHVLAGLHTPAGLLALATHAEEAGDRVRARTALDRGIDGLRGAARLFAELTAAELALDEGDRERAEAHLGGIEQYGGAPEAVRVLRERHGLSRPPRAGDPLAAQADTLDEALHELAKVLLAPTHDGARELALLDAARTHGLPSRLAHALQVDAALSTGAVDRATELLDRLDEREPGAHLGGLRLALARGARASGDASGEERLLRAFIRAYGHDPLAVFPLARHLERTAPKDAASLLTSALPGGGAELAPVLATWAARIVGRSGADPQPQLALALADAPGHVPALTLLALAHAGRDARGAPADAWIDAARATADASLRALLLTRAAMLRAGDHRGDAGALLREALTLMPGDMFLLELTLATAPELTAAERAELLERGMGSAPEPWARALGLRAASYWGAARAFEHAAELYRRHAQRDDLLARRGLDRIEMAAGDVARVAARRFGELRNAPSPGARVAALESLADIDLFERQDVLAASVSFASILEVDPDHAGALLALAAHQMRRGRFDELEPLVERLARASSAPADITAWARLGHRAALAAGGQTTDALERWILELWPRAEASLWLARQTVAAGASQGEPQRVGEAGASAVAFLEAGTERASAAVTAARAYASLGQLEAAERLLQTATDAFPHHPTAATELAEVRTHRGNLAGAAEALELAAATAADEERSVALWYRAALHWQDDLKDRGRARVAFENIVDRNVKFADAFERLRTLLRREKDHARLRDLCLARIAAGADPPVLAAVYLTLADACEALGEEAESVEALRAALTLDGERAPLWRQLAAKYRRREDWRAATDALVRLARLEADPTELKQVFLDLGELYATRIRDFERAEAAYRRALELDPDEAVLEKLADVLERAGHHERLVETLGALLERSAVGLSRKALVLRRAKALEALDRARDSEDDLERLRRDMPTDMDVFRALGGLYERRRAHAALSLHQSRMASDLRSAITLTPGDERLIPDLVEVFLARRRPDAARVAASTAAALGIARVDLAELLRTDGGVRGAGGRAFETAVDDSLAPDGFEPATRAALAHLGPIFDRLDPPDTKTLGLRRLPHDDPRIHRSVQTVAKWIGMDVVVHETAQLGRVCFALRASPLEVVMSRRLLDAATEPERVFLLARSAKIALSGLSAIARLEATHLAQLLEAASDVLALKGRPARATKSHAALVGRLTRALPRADRDGLRTLVLEMTGRESYSAREVAAAACGFGDRAALLAQGSVGAGLGALLKLAGVSRPLSGGPHVRAAALAHVPEAMGLVLFALSEEHFEARIRTAADRAPRS